MKSGKRAYALAILAALLGLVAFGCAMTPHYNGPKGPNFDGVRFRNTIAGDKTIVDIVSFVSTFWLRKEPWPKAVENGDFPPPEPLPKGVTVTFINHSTVLLQFDDLNVLTDPIWSERASPFSFAGPRRVRPPGLALEELPPIDLVLVSHDHYDHLDVNTLPRLRGRRSGEPPLVLAGLATGRIFKRYGIDNYRELDWGESVTVGDTRVSFVETRHRSGRGLTDQMKTLWGGFVIEHPDLRVYFAGDTGYGAHFRDARTTYGPFDLAFIPIGAYRPRWFMAPQHLDPEGAVRAHQELGTHRSIAIHHGTFQLTYEPIDEPYRELKKWLEAADLEPSVFRVLGFGESITVPGRAATASAAAAARGRVRPGATRPPAGRNRSSMPGGRRARVAQH